MVLFTIVLLELEDLSMEESAVRQALDAIGKILRGVRILDNRARGRMGIRISGREKRGRVYEVETSAQDEI